MMRNKKIYTKFWYKNLKNLTHIGEEGRIIIWVDETGLDYSPVGENAMTNHITGDFYTR
jgi:hypothetical protein